MLKIMFKFAHKGKRFFINSNNFFKKSAFFFDFLTNYLYIIFSSIYVLIKYYKTEAHELRIKICQKISNINMFNTFIRVFKRFFRSYDYFGVVIPYFKEVAKFSFDCFGFINFNSNLDIQEFTIFTTYKINFFGSKCTNLF